MQATPATMVYTVVRRPADALAVCQLLRGRSDYIVPGPPSGSGLTLASKPTGYAEGKGPTRGAAAIVELLERRGVTLQLRHGRLLPIAAGRMPPAVAELLQHAERLLLAHLQGGASCELDHAKETPPEAWTVPVGGVLACQAHATGELQP